MLIQQHPLIDDHRPQREQLRALQALHRHLHSPLKDVGSCAASVCSEVIKAHPANQIGGDAFRIDHGLIRDHIEMQVLLVDPAEGTQIGAERRSCPFTGVAVDLASAVPIIIIPGPFVDAVADRGMGWMTPPVALPFIDIQLRAASRKVFDDESMTSPPIRVVAHPKTLLTRLTRDDTDDRGPIVGVGAVAFALIGASAGRVIRVAMGRAFFPRVLIPLVRLKGGAHHHIGGCTGVQPGLDALPEGMELFARQPQLARQAGHRLSLGNPTQQ